MVTNTLLFLAHLGQAMAVEAATVAILTPRFGAGQAHEAACSLWAASDKAAQAAFDSSQESWLASVCNWCYCTECTDSCLEGQALDAEVRAHCGPEYD
jgi:hypothetical protein